MSEVARNHDFRFNVAAKFLGPIGLGKGDTEAKKY